MARDVEIRITETADTAGGRKVEESLESVGKRAVETGDRMRRMGSEAGEGLSALGSMVSAVSPQMGGLMMVASRLTGGLKGLGAALKAVVANPVMLALTALAAGVALVTRHVGESERRLKSWLDRLQAARDRNIEGNNREIARSFAEMGRAIDETAGKLDHLRQVEEMRTRARRGIADAQSGMAMEAEMMGAANGDERAGIARRYARERQAAEAQRRREDIRRSAGFMDGDSSVEDVERREAETYGRRRGQLEREAELRRRNIANIEAKQSQIRDEYAGRLQNSVSVWTGRKYAAPPTEERKEQLQDMFLAEDRRKAQEGDELARVQAELAKLEREQAQAAERRKAALEELAAVEAREAERKAREEREDADRRDAERRADEARRRVSDDMERGILEADRAARERRMEGGTDADGLMSMRESDLVNATARLADARERLAEYLDSLNGRTDLTEGEQVRLGEMRGDVSRYAGERRNAQDSLWDAAIRMAREERMGADVYRIGGGDRISQMGGFATARSAAVGGAFVAVDRKETMIDEIRKLNERANEMLRGILDNTDGGEVAVAG